MSYGSTITSELTTQSRTMDNFVIIWFDSNFDESNEDTGNSINHLQNIRDKTVFMIIHESFGQ
jgi:hypothetical protein